MWSLHPTIQGQNISPRISNDGIDGTEYLADIRS
jgi:hypothetical protein